MAFLFGYGLSLTLLAVLELTSYAYLAAGTVYHRFRAASGLEPRPILVSTSSIAAE